MVNDSTKAKTRAGTYGPLFLIGLYVLLTWSDLALGETEKVSKSSVEISVSG